MLYSKTIFIISFFLSLQSQASLFRNIEIKGSTQEVQQIESALSQAYQTKIGQKLIDNIQSSNHTLTIEHQTEVLRVAGRVLFPLSQKASNGTGVDATLNFHFFMPEHGAHEILTCQYGRAPFMYMENFIHELKHASDALNGNIIWHRFEEDAVDMENIFRQEKGLDYQRCLSDEDDHIWQLWFGNSDSK